MTGALHCNANTCVVYPVSVISLPACASTNAKTMKLSEDTQINNNESKLFMELGASLSFARKAVLVDLYSTW